jgi:hypothetical protein
MGGEVNLLKEFTIDYDEIDYLYYLVHRGCESVEMAVNNELPASSATLWESIQMAKKHMKEVHNVDLEKTGPDDCGNSAFHFLNERCEICGYTP